MARRARMFIHDAIDYLLTPLDLTSTLVNARAHCRDGGVVLLVPDHFRESFRAGADQGGGDRDGRSLRYLDRLRKTAAGWRICDRVQTLDWSGEMPATFAGAFSERITAMLPQRTG